MDRQGHQQLPGEPANALAVVLVLFMILMLFMVLMLIGVLGVIPMHLWMRRRFGMLGMVGVLGMHRRLMRLGLARATVVMR